MTIKYFLHWQKDTLLCKKESFQLKVCTECKIGGPKVEGDDKV